MLRHELLPHVANKNKKSSWPIALLRFSLGADTLQKLSKDKCAIFYKERKFYFQTSLVQAIQRIPFSFLSRSIFHILITDFELHDHSTCTSCMKISSNNTINSSNYSSDILNQKSSKTFISIERKTEIRQFFVQASFCARRHEAGTARVTKGTRGKIPQSRRRTRTRSTELSCKEKKNNDNKG